MKKINRFAYTFVEMLVMIFFIVVVVVVTVGILRITHSFKQTQVIRELKTVESAVTSYYVFSHPNKFPPNSNTVVSSYLLNVNRPKLDRPLYDPLSKRANVEYGYKKSANGKFYLIYSKGFNGVEGSELQINDQGKVFGLDEDDFCVTNGSGCADYACCNGICAPVEDLHSCMTCEKGCSKNESCVQGVCCGLEFNISCYGECINSQSDVNNCGGCDNVCPSKAICTNGRCACPHETCDRTCVDTQIDNQNCGNCGIVCPSNSTCSKGVCICSDPRNKVCNNLCINTQSDDNNCGDCQNVCPMNTHCLKGSCVCPFNMCDDNCVNLQSDNNNCGNCNNACSSEQNCSQGECR